MIEIRDERAAVEMRVHKAVHETCGEALDAGYPLTRSPAGCALRALRSDVYQGIDRVGRPVRAELVELYSRL